MAGLLFDEQAFQVIKSFRPYLGPRGNELAVVLESLSDLLQSEPAQGFWEALLKVVPVENQELFRDGKQQKTNPFTLFLILILLLLSDFSNISKQGSEQINNINS